MRTTGMRRTVRWRAVAPTGRCSVSVCCDDVAHVNGSVPGESLFGVPLASKKRIRMSAREALRGVSRVPRLLARSYFHVDNR